MVSREERPIAHAKQPFYGGVATTPVGVRPRGGRLFVGEDTVLPYDGFVKLHETAEKNPDSAKLILLRTENPPVFSRWDEWTPNLLYNIYEDESQVLVSEKTQIAL